VAVALELRDPEGRALGRERPSNFESTLREAEAELPAGVLAAPIQIERAASTAQLLLRRAGVLPSILARLGDVLHPYRCVVGLGFGSIEVQTGGSSMHIAGESFDRARAALWAARRDKHSAAAVGFGEPEASMIASMIEMMDRIRAGWTERQAETVRAARRAKGKEVAAHFGVSPSVVSESLKAASFRPLMRAENSLSQLLDHFGTDGIWRGEDVRFPDLVSPVSKESRELLARR
jgi:hypothetical protein